MAEVVSPLAGTVARIERTAGAAVAASTTVLVVESMKMEYAIEAGVAGTVAEVRVAEGDAVKAGDLLAVVRAGEAGDGAEAAAAAAPPPDRAARADLADVVERHAVGLDPARPDAVARRRATGQRTARENVDDLVDAGTFVEFGPLAIAAQRRRRPVDDLIARTPADGLVAGVGTVDGRPTAVLTYDYTVLAGTQGYQNHRKKDRLFDVIERQRLPVVFFAEGGGGRPGDTDAPGVSGLDTMAFHLWGRLSGLVPLVGITSGRCFAGNAAILGSSDVVIATRGSNIGMGGPAMIEGGGLGVFAPEDIGPLDVQAANGVVDVVVEDEAEAVAVARRYLSYFAGPTDDWTAVDQAALRDLIPENRRRVYDVRAVLAALADTGSVLELRRAFGAGMVTALARVEGRPLGIVANDPAHLAGAIDADGADKASRFLGLCDAFDIPLLFLLRHAGDHGRSGRRGHGAGPPRQPAVRDRRQPDGAVRHDHPAQGLRARGPDDGGRELQGPAVLRRLADRRAGRHGPGGRGAPRLPQRPRRHRGRGRARGRLPAHGRGGLPAGQGAQRRQPLRDRRRDRPRRQPPVGHDHARVHPARAAA